MPSYQRIRFAYFGWSVEFSSTTVSQAALRAEANALVIAEHGLNPALSYYEPGIPFPDFVPADVWEDGKWQPYC